MIGNRWTRRFRKPAFANCDAKQFRDCVCEFSLRNAPWNIRASLFKPLLQITTRSFAELNVCPHCACCTVFSFHRIYKFFKYVLLLSPTSLQLEHVVPEIVDEVPEQPAPWQKWINYSSPYKSQSDVLNRKRFCLELYFFYL